MSKQKRKGQKPGLFLRMTVVGMNLFPMIFAVAEFAAAKGLLPP
jgi:hypothetical protein